MTTHTTARTLALMAAFAATGIPAAHAQAPTPQRMIVAIDKFEDASGREDSDILSKLRARIQHRVVGTRKFEVVERENLKSVLSEIRHAEAGLTNETGAPVSGNLKAAGYVLYGAVLSWSADCAAAQVVGLQSARARTKVELQLKIADAETGRILASKVVVGTGRGAEVGSAEVARDGVSAPSSQIVREAVENAAALAVDALRELCYPAKVINVGRDITLNMTQEEVSEGELFELYEAGRPLYDPDTGAYLGAEGDLLGRIRIVRPGAMTSRAVPVDGLDISRVAVGGIVHRVSADTLAREARRRWDKALESFESRF